jgi:hypothetical protein
MAAFTLVQMTRLAMMVVRCESRAQRLARPSTALQPLLQPIA